MRTCWCEWVHDCQSKQEFEHCTAWLAHMAARLGLPIVNTVWRWTGQTSDASAFTVSPDGRKSHLSTSAVLYTAKRLHSSAGVTQTQTPTAPSVSLMKLQVKYTLSKYLWYIATITPRDYRTELVHVISSLRHRVCIWRCLQRNILLSVNNIM